MRKWTAAVAIALLLLLAGIYLGSPYYAAWSLRSAVQAGDAGRIAALVDFPAVRASIEPQVTAAITAKLEQDPRMRDGAYAAMGLMLLPGVVHETSKAFVTPRGLAALMRLQRPHEQGEPGAEGEVESRAGYESLDRFRIRFRKPGSSREGPSFLLARRDFVSWKLVSIDLPPDLLD